MDIVGQRDQEMSAFIDGFDESVANILREQREAQFMVVALLEHIGTSLSICIRRIADD